MNFKNYSLLILFSIAFVLPASATKWRVNNTLSGPDQVDFNELTEAVASANQGDTIYVEGSATPYAGNVEVDRKLTIIGPGLLLDIDTTVCNHLNAVIGVGVQPSIVLKSGSDGTYITGLTLVSNSSTSGIRFTQNTDPIANITITRNRVNSIFIGGNSQVSFVFIRHNLICNDIAFELNSVSDNIHITNNLIGDDVYNSSNSIEINNSTVRNNTLGLNSIISVEGAVISYNYVGRINPDMNNIAIENNILGIDNDAGNQAIKNLYPSNVCNSYETDGWNCDTDNWEYALNDQTTTHGAYNGLDPYPTAISNLPAWPVIQACTVQACGDTTIQVQFVVRSNN